MSDLRREPSVEDGLFPATKSFLSADALGRTVEHAYRLRRVRCRLLGASMRDVYLVTTDGGDHFVLFVYRYGQRTPEQIEAEWAFVDHVRAQGAPVAPALRQWNGDLLLTFAAPEGIRYGVASVYSAGEHLRRRYSAEAVRKYGRTVAQIHRAGDTYADAAHRPRHDESFFLDRCLAAVWATEILSEADRDYLREAAGRLRERIGALPKTLPSFGMIHGDVIRANAQVGDDEGVTVLDFDLCGLGWRAYDVASLLQVYAGLPEEAEATRAFLDGYEEVRALADGERETLPLFQAARYVFDLGIPAMNLDHWGTAHLSDDAIKTALNGLRRAMETAEL
jgi:Ser/Thr protein kinase RdoA (MazF antagonist)